MVAFATCSGVYAQCRRPFTCSSYDQRLVYTPNLCVNSSYLDTRLIVDPLVPMESGTRGRKLSRDGSDDAEEHVSKRTKKGKGKAKET